VADFEDHDPVFLSDVPDQVGRDNRQFAPRSTDRTTAIWSALKTARRVQCRAAKRRAAMGLNWAT
jgi:hypothetical protein